MTLLEMSLPIDVQLTYFSGSDVKNTVMNFAGGPSRSLDIRTEFAMVGSLSTQHSDFGVIG
jgi:hypothetical protein